MHRLILIRRKLYFLITNFMKNVDWKGTPKGTQGKLFEFVCNCVNWLMSNWHNLLSYLEKTVIPHGTPSPTNKTTKQKKHRVAWLGKTNASTWNYWTVLHMTPISIPRYYDYNIFLQGSWEPTDCSSSVFFMTSLSGRCLSIIAKRFKILLNHYITLNYSLLFDLVWLPFIFKATDQNIIC